MAKKAPEAAPTPVETPQVDAVTITLSVNDLNFMMVALQELPHRVVEPLIKKIQQQVQSQLPPTPQ
jgi:hypothetical protein